MRIILTGVTGVAGLSIYRAALNDPAIHQITLLTRRAVPAWAALPHNADNKTNLVIHTDFNRYEPELAHRLAQHDALIWALGKSSAGMSEREYTELTHDYTIAAARALKDAGAGSAEHPFRFVFVSGEHADPTGESRQMWARVKGRVEHELQELCEGTNMRAQTFRPAYFSPSREHPQDRLHQRGAIFRALDTVLAPLTNALAPSFYTPIEDFGRFAVELAKGRWPEQDMYRNAEMRELVKTI